MSGNSKEQQKQEQQNRAKAAKSSPEQEVGKRLDGPNRPAE